jgi:hypothetical protein
LLVATVGAAPLGCLLVAPLGDLAGGTPDDAAVLDAPSGADRTADGGSSAADVSSEPSPSPDSDAGADAALEATSPCPTAPPAAVRITVGTTTECVDSTEVTIADYTQFLAATGGDTSGQRADCTWNTSFVPGGWPTSGATDLPVTGVNQCDAVAYCAWAGKRLCGAIDGGTLDTGSIYDPSASQWYFACSHNDDGLHAYPYGNTYDASACNGDDPDAGPVGVGTLPGCFGGFTGLWDMSGNVWEWVDACDGTTSTNNCIIGGGAYTSTPGELSCQSAVIVLAERSGGYPDIGFRCCAP